MRWWAWVGLGLLIVSMQATLAVHVQLGPVRPDWPLLLVVALGMAAPQREALLGSLATGLILDLHTIGPLGMFTFVFGLAGWVVVQVREMLFTDSLLTNVAMTLWISGLTQLLVALLRYFQEGAEQYAGSPLWEAAGTALYTTLWAVPFHWLFIRGRRALGLVRYGRAAMREA